MATPKKKNDISVYQGNELVDRRQELLDKITQGDSYLPDSVLHDDLDLGMLEFVKNNSYSKRLQLLFFLKVNRLEFRFIESLLITAN